MNQLTLASLEADIVASVARRQKTLCEELIQEIQQRRLSRDEALDRIKCIELSLRRLIRAA